MASWAAIFLRNDCMSTGFMSQPYSKGLHDASAAWEKMRDLIGPTTEGRSASLRSKRRDVAWAYAGGVKLAAAFAELSIRDRAKRAPRPHRGKVRLVYHKKTYEHDVACV